MNRRVAVALSTAILIALLVLDFCSDVFLTAEPDKQQAWDWTLSAWFVFTSAMLGWLAASRD
jgi:hypothetical protein